jgi:hypothetical protein
VVRRGISDAIERGSSAFDLRDDVVEDVRVEIERMHEHFSKTAGR